VSLQIIHVAMPTVGQPFSEALGSVHDIDIGNTDPRKTQLNAPLPNARRECSQIGRAIARSQGSAEFLVQKRRRYGCHG
jgi:hypothetical protein